MALKRNEVFINLIILSYFIPSISFQKLDMSTVYHQFYNESAKLYFLGRKEILVELQGRKGFRVFENVSELHRRLFLLFNL